MLRFIRLTTVMCLTAFFLFGTMALAQTEKKIKAKLAAAAQNPLASMISLPIQNNTTYGGVDGDVLNVLNIQPVLPFNISEGLNLITRTILPVISSPYGPGGAQESGIGNLTLTGWLSPKIPTNNIVWGVGPVFSVPTASSSVLGADQWGGGLSAVGVWIDGPWVAGGMVNNIWGFDDTSELNSFLFQYFVNYNLNHGWYVVSAPIITANWNAPAGGQWVIPFGGGVGKIMRFGGKLPVNFNAHFYFNVDKPESYGDYTARVQLQFMFPK